MGRIRRPGPQPISRARRDAGGFRREALQFAFEIANHVGGCREKLVVVLIAAAEGDIVVGVFACALVPFGAHALAYVFHVAILSGQFSDGCSMRSITMKSPGPLAASSFKPNCS